jgi:type II secretory pathway pseudopilin PulG
MMKNRQGGVISIDIMGGLAVLLAILALMLPALKSDTDAQLNQSAADHANTFAQAANKWLSDNQSTVFAAANPLAQYSATDIAAYLPAGFSAQSPYGQSYSIRVYKNAGTLQPIIVTTGGDTISNDNLHRLAGMIKGGGYVDSVNTTTIKGVFGGWQIPFTNYGTSPGAGHIAVGLFVLNQGTTDQYVYRNAISGHPELNAINTPLKLNIVVTAGTSDALCVVGDPTTYGRVAADNIGAVMSCQNGQWERQSGYWKDPVSTFSALPTTGNNTGDVRLTTDTSRAFSWNGTSWIALAVDQNGNLSMPGDLTARTLTPSLIATEGTSCAGYQSGALAQSSTTPGLTLSCQSGSWKSMKTNTLVGLIVSTTSGNCPGLGYPYVWWSNGSYDLCSK